VTKRTKSSAIAEGPRDVLVRILTIYTTLVSILYATIECVGILMYSGKTEYVVLKIVCSKHFKESLCIFSSKSDTQLT